MTQYTAQTIKQKFEKVALGRKTQKKAGKSEYQKDAGYWEGGRCNWGGAHNLQEDCERLAEFFAGITELRNCRKELINFNNQQEFEKNKQKLLEKVNEIINGLQMRTSNSTSIAGVCIIWNDFKDHFDSQIENFRKDLEMLKCGIERVPYNEAKELQKLNVEERNLKSEIEENKRRANNEADENKRNQFIFLVNQAAEDLKKLLARKSQLKTARLGDDFNPDQHIDNFLKAVENKLSGKNRPPRPTRTSNPNQQPTSSDNSAGSSDNSSSNPLNNNEQKPFLEKYWKELLLGGSFLFGIYYICKQPNDHE